MAGNSGSGGNPVIMSGGDIKKPLNLLFAISEIQVTGATEKDLTGKIGENFLSVVFRWDFFSIGLRNSLMSGLVSLFITPLTLGVFYKLIPVFNDAVPTLFDKIYALFFNFSLSIGFGLFLSKIKKSWTGTLSKGMIKSLLGGFVLGEFIKNVIIFILFNWIYLQMSSKNLYNALLFLKDHNVIPFFQNYFSVYEWLLDFRNVFPIAAVLVLISSLTTVGIPIASIGYYVYKNKKF